MSAHLNRLGARPDHYTLHEQLNLPDTVLARVVEVHRGQVDVVTDEGPCRAFLLHHQDTPAVGDWCAVQPSPESGIPPMVRALLPRHTSFSRKVAGRRSDGQVIVCATTTICTPQRQLLFPTGRSCRRSRTAQAQLTSSSVVWGHLIGSRSPRRRHPSVRRPHSVRSGAASGRPGSRRSSPEPRAGEGAQRLARAWRGLRGRRPGRERGRRYAQRASDGWRA